ncbi:MAG: hypothetical protein QOI47_474 [Actinomycetota bacterium]|nr:hypothetical protein [Actinomycetota bacterium]
MHLGWDPAPPPSLEVSVTLEIVEPPSVAELYFWALQVSFLERGRRVGGAHLGLQWYPLHPGGTAVNWGGYRDGAGELDGESSPLPSATGNPNTRDFAWRPHTPYRLRVRGDGDGWWSGAVTDLATDATTVVRRLFGGGDALGEPVVWSEVFARCDDPRVAVRWSDFSPAPRRLRESYQSHVDGGCANTRSSPDGDGWVQVTNAMRGTG